MAFWLVIIIPGYIEAKKQGLVNESTGQKMDSAALLMWRSPDSSLEQRANAVERLIPKGSRSEEIKRMLGAQGTWNHYHGPTIDLVSGATNLPVTDMWRLEYRFGSGGVCLFFDPQTPFGGFSGASPFRILSPSPLTNRP